MGKKQETQILCMREEGGIKIVSRRIPAVPAIQSESKVKTPARKTNSCGRFYLIDFKCYCLLPHFSLA